MIRKTVNSCEESKLTSRRHSEEILHPQNKNRNLEKERKTQGTKTR